MASCIKEESNKSAESDSDHSHVYSHNPDEFIDIHGSQSSNSLHAISQDISAPKHNEDITSKKYCDSKVLKETSDTFIQSCSSQNSTCDLKLPVQETQHSQAVVADLPHDSDEEYQSAEEGEEENETDDEENDFIPTSDMLTKDDQTEALKTDLAEARLSDNSCDADESEAEGASCEDKTVLQENEEVEEVDPLEERRKMEEKLTREEKQERKVKSQQMKDDGNIKFRNSEYDEAILSYTEALALCPLDFHKERSIMFSNRAACKMKQEYYEDAIEDSSSALELHPHYLKAMLRRAELYEKTEKLDEALKDYQSVVELDPSQHAARAACLKLAEQIKDRNEKMKEEMIGKLKDLGDMVLRPFEQTPQKCIPASQPHKPMFI
ncbi:tetratricopeptide repeat protein 1-like [Plakobranchus ocellatus]|uniref:Tetratricopeptide repeat protein 1-like n=1 Tax=Plakobranchus ocellatus TaxID=259542 RepID=A0AAV4CGU6_9GAST|nr:tetratricopeptide repeat protein 1-like [Plakobranchus ocellatus]